MYIILADAARVLDRTERAVQIALQKGKYEARRVPNPHGGRPIWEIELSSLPEDAQARYWEQVRIAEQVAAAKRGGRPSKAAQAARKRAEERAAQEVAANEEYLAAPDWQKAVVDERVYIVTSTEGMSQKEAQVWLDQHGFRCSVSTWHRWRKAYAEGGKNALMTAYGNRKGESSIPDDVFNVWCSQYLTEGKASAKAAWYQARGYFQEHYTGKMPSLDSFEYRMNRDLPLGAVYMARNGESAYNRKYGYSITRDLSALRAGECAVGDHMQLDLQVAMPDGSVVRPWLTAWIDMKSRKFLGWYLHAEAPNSDHIFRAFADMARNYGLPDEIYIDNGKDYRCRDFAGGRKTVRVECDTQRATSLTADLGIKVNFAIPYNAQAKVIERRFRDFHDNFERLLEGYTGSTIPKRPESLKKQVKTGKILSFEQATELLQTFITQILDKMPFGSKAQLANSSPDQIWVADNPVLRRPNPRALAMFCMRTSKAIKVGKSGIKDPDLKVVYWAPELTEMKGRTVYLRRDLDNYSTAYVFDENDQFVCEARYEQGVSPLAKDDVSKAQLAEGMARKKRELKSIKKLLNSQEQLPPEERFRLMQLGVEATNKARGYIDPTAEPKVIAVQSTPLDRRALEIEERRREATTDQPVNLVANPTPSPKRNLCVWMSDEN